MKKIVRIFNSTQIENYTYKNFSEQDTSIRPFERKQLETT